VPARFKTAKQASAQLPEVRALEVKGEPPNKRNVEVEEDFCFMPLRQAQEVVKVLAFKGKMYE
jgi:hypothetical protein